jgi:hypothetical protein
MDMGWTRVFRVGAVQVVLLAAVVACGGQARPEVDPGAPVTSAPKPDDGSSTRNEGAGNQDDAGGLGPSVKLPALPVGGGVEAQSDPNHQCVQVNWIVDTQGAALASGIEVKVAGAGVTSNVFVVDNLSCDGSLPNCLGFVFSADSQACAVAVEARNVTPDAQSDSARVYLIGELSCGTAVTALCASFADAVRHEQTTSIPLDPPDLSVFSSTTPPTDGTDGSTPPTDGAGGSGTSTDGTDGSGTPTSAPAGDSAESPSADG